MTINFKPFVYIDEDISSESLERGLARVKSAGSLSALILCATHKAENCNNYDAVLRGSKIPVFGGVFPQLLYDGKRLKESLLVLGLPTKIDYITFKNISKSSRYNAATTESNAFSAIQNNKNFFLIVDGLSPANEAFIDETYQHLGSGNNYIGGGAGYTNFVQQPCIITNEGLLADTALVAASPWDLNLSTCHGWEILSGPYLATDTENGRIKTINYQPALHAYKQAIPQNTDIPSTVDDVFTTSTSYPFGVQGINDEIIVRDALSIEGDDIICAGEILPNSKIYILHGSKEKIVADVRCSLGKKNESENLALIFHCISRDVFLGDGTEQELKLIKSELPNCLLLGVFSIGEIVTGESGAINWLNKSVSIARLAVN